MIKLLPTKQIVLNSVFVSVLVFFFLPAEIYVGNPLEFVSTPLVLVTNLLLFCGLFALLLMLPGFVPIKLWRKVYSTFLGGSFLALWVSGVFLVGDFGEFDGASFDLSKHTEILSDHSLWFKLILVLTCLTVWKWPAHLNRAITVIGTGLFIIGIANFYLAGSNQKTSWEPVNLKEFSRFSSEKNLLIVLMDTFQSDVFDDILKRDKTLARQLDGFQFYPDTMGVAPSTYLTMPAFHSGQTYNNMITLSEYYDVGVEEGSFLVELAEHGYQVDLINPITSVCPRGASTCKFQENLLLHNQQVTDSETSRLADLGLLRVIPGLLKQQIFDGNAGPISRLRNEVALSGLGHRVYQGNTVLQLMADSLWTDDSAPTAKLIHLFNTHAPYMFASDCQFVGVKNTQDRAHMTMQSECAMRWFVYLLEKMKQAGVYDHSMIILTADTGAGTIYGDDDLSSHYALAQGQESGELGRLMGGANPVLAIKYPGATGAIQRSNLQAQLSDIPKTVCASLNDCKKDLGINLRSDVPGTRIRPYVYYRWQNNYWGLNHIPGMIYYSIEGPLWLGSSWTRSFSENLRSSMTEVKFSEDDEDEIFGLGWSHVEVNQAGISKRWSIAKRAELFLPLPVGENISLQFKVLNAPGLSDQVMTIKVNGEIVGSRHLEDRVQFVTANVPATLVSSPLSEVVLEFSELKLPENPARRKISVSFYQLKIFLSGGEQ